MNVKRISALFLACLFLMGMHAYAAIREPDVLPLYTHIDSLASTIKIFAGNAQSAGKIRFQNNRRASITVKLQQKVDGKWKTLQSWTDSNSSGVCSAGGSKSVEKGYSHRTYVTGRVYDSRGNCLETASKASSSKYY